MGDRQAGVADFRDACANLNGVRVAEWPAIIAVDRGEDWPKSCAGYGVAQANPIEAR